MRVLVTMLLLCLLPVLVSGEISFVVEEPSLSSEGRHVHRHHRRHQKAHDGHETSSPYRAAASTVTAADSAIPDQFSLNCPHVADASNAKVGIEVTWTLDDTVWLKIRDGDKKIANQLTSFQKRPIGGKSVVHAHLADGRYIFHYDELTGDFSMEISPVLASEDAGVWQCHVTVRESGRTHTLTSRNRIKAPHGGAKKDNDKARPTPPMDSGRRMPDAYFPPARIDYEPAQKISSFTRPEQNLVQISRDNQKRRQTVVFDRNGGAVTKEYPRHAESRQAVIDYELSMADDDMFEEEGRLGRSRTRAAYHSNGGGTLSALSTTLGVVAAVMLL